MASSRTSGAAFVDHWVFARNKGLMNISTAKALEASCRRVLEVLDNWQDVDITTLDIDDLVSRFNNLNATNFKPQSLKDYERRFRRAVSSYTEFLDNPSGWKYATRTPRRRASPTKGGQDTTVQKSTDADSPENSPPTPSSYTYTYPFREGCLAKLDIPLDAKAAEMERLVAWARTLAVDYEPPK